MNIFFLSRNFRKCSRYHADVHVVKMILETAQLLFTAHHVTNNGVSLENCNVKVYKKTHVNHPSAIWVRQSIHHYLWLVNLGLWLCYEYTYRYRKIHATQEAMEWLAKNFPDLPDNKFTDPPQAMPDEFKNENCIKAYREYYIHKSKTLTRFGYKNRKMPSWLEIHP